MSETAAFEEVTRIRMSREIGGTPVCWVAASLILSTLRMEGSS